MRDKLEGRYGFSVAVSMVVGIVIGIGIFFKATQILTAAGMNPKIALLAWALGGAISIISGLTAAEVGAAIPETGGMIAWIKRIYGPKTSFLVGWAQMIIYFPALIGIISYYFAFFTTNFLGIEATPGVLIPISFGVMTLVYVLNVFTNRVGGIIQTSATVAKLIPLGLITVFGLLSANNHLGALHVSQKAMENTSSPILLLGLALVPVMFAFDGWVFVGTIAGDLKNVKKDLPRAIILGIGFIAIFYLLLNYSLLKVFPAEELVEKGMFGVAERLFGNMGARFVFLGIMISAFGGLNGMTMASTRVPYTLAIEGHLPKENFFSKVDPKNRQPINSSVFMYVMACIVLSLMFITGQVDVFGDIPVALFWLFYCLVFVGLFILRKREPNMERPYKVPLYPIIPLLALIGGGSIFIYATIANPMYMAISLVITFIGLFVYKSKEK